MKKSMRKLLVLCLTLTMLVVNSLSVLGAVAGDFNVTFKFIDEDTNEVVKTADHVVNGTEGENILVDVESMMPENYKLAECSDNGFGYVVVTPYSDMKNVKDVFVKKVQTIPTETVLNVTFETVDGTKVGTATASTTAVGGEGEAWTFMLGTDFNLPKGYQLATGVDQVTNIDVPFGAIGGHTMIVEAIPAETTETVLNVTFETVAGEVVGTTTASTTAVGGEGEAWTFMLGQDFNLPEGYQLATGVEQVTNIDVPFGAIGGHTMVVEAIPTVDPVDPVDPVTPVQPTTPDNSNKENTATDNKVTDKADKKADKADKKADKAKEAKSPKTGDMTNVAMNAFVMVICAIAIVTVICRKRYARK